jgi:hypothetical protein
LPECVSVGSTILFVGQTSVSESIEFRKLSAATNSDESQET